MRVSDVEAVTIRRAGSQDLLPLLTLRASWRGMAVTDGYLVEFSAWFEREGSQRWWWLAEDPAGRAVGMVNLKIFDRMPEPGGGAGRWGYLANLFVEPSHRNAGVGARLLAELMETSRVEGLARVVLSPSEQSLPLYRRAGFVPADMLFVWRPAPHGNHM